MRRLSTMLDWGNISAAALCPHPHQPTVSLCLANWLIIQHAGWDWGGGSQVQVQQHSASSTHTQQWHSLVSGRNHFTANQRGISNSFCKYTDSTTSHLHFINRLSSSHPEYFCSCAVWAKLINEVYFCFTGSQNSQNSYCVFIVINRVFVGALLNWTGTI